MLPQHPPMSISLLLNQQPPQPQGAPQNIELSSQEKQVLKEINSLLHSNDPRKTERLKSLLKENPNVAEYLKSRFPNKK
jgi:hypothetical protein